MTLAVLATWAQPQVIHHWWIVFAILAGFAVGYPLSRVPLTAVPQRTALSHAFGGLAAGLVGTAKFYLWLRNEPEMLTTKRPGNGIPALRLAELVGRRAARTLEADHQLEEADVV